jgi:hypothetical protein
MIGFGQKFLFVMAALGIILVSTIPSYYQSTTGSLTSSVNRTDDFNTATNKSLTSDKNQTKTQIPNSTRGMAEKLQNTTNQNSNLSSSVPAQATSNLVITSPDQQERLQENEGNQIPIIQPPTQSVEQAAVVSSPPLYQQEPFVIQTQQALQPQISPLLSAYPEAPSLIQLSQNLPFLISTYLEAPSLIQSQLLSQSIPQELILQPLYSYPVNTPIIFPVLQPEIIEPIEIPPRILSHSTYVDSTGNLNIVGEVINESFQSLRFVQIIATFYDSNSSVIGTDFTFTTPSTIPPGQRATFDIIVSEGSIPTSLLAYYTLSVDYLDF